MPTIEEYQTQYLTQLTEKEKKAYEIAKGYLGSSFNLSKSIGFQKWLKKNIKHLLVIYTQSLS